VSVEADDVQTIAAGPIHRLTTPGLASEPATSTRRTPPSEGADNPIDGHHPPTTFHVGAATANVTSLPEVITAIGTPFHDATAPVATTFASALTGLRLRRTLATDGEDATVPPKYRGLMTAARAAGIPVAVKGGGVATALVVGAAGVALATFGDEEQALTARATVKTVAIPTKRGRRDKGGEKGNMSQPYGVPTLLPRTPGPDAAGRPDLSVNWLRGRPGS